MCIPQVIYDFSDYLCASPLNDSPSFTKTVYGLQIYLNLSCAFRNWWWQSSQKDSECKALVSYDVLLCNTVLLFIRRPTDQK